MKKRIWTPQLAQLELDLSALSSNWISYPDSMTTRVKKSFQQMTIKLYQHQRGKVHPEEALYLGISSRTATLVREIEMFCDGTPWLTARTIIPYVGLVGENRRLLKLGNTPIGKLLYKNNRMVRSPLLFSLIDPLQFFFHGQQMTPSQIPLLPARRSLFHSGKQTILLTEVFHSAMLKMTGSLIDE